MGRIIGVIHTRRGKELLVEHVRFFGLFHSGYRILVSDTTVVQAGLILWHAPSKQQSPQHNVA